MIAGLAGLFIAFAAVLVLERFVKPRRNDAPIFHKVGLLAAMPLILFYVSILMLTYRPMFSTVFVIIVFLGIVVVNNAKVRELREPLVYSDFALLRQAIAHPALYVGYIGPWKVAAVLSAGTLALVAGLVYEEPIVRRDEAAEWMPTLAYCLVVFGSIYAITRGPLRNEFRQILGIFGPSTDVREDVAKLSLVTTLIFYFLLAGESEEAIAQSRKNEDEDRARPFGQSNLRPSVIVVQSESFFDARRIMEKPPAGFLKHFDRMAGEARYSGRLRVPAWGANTLRTEFAFLSGIPDEAMGVDRFNPYLGYCAKPVWTIASYLRSVGYRTVCIHPYHKSFFRRDRAYPHLGFDEFIDVASFAESDRIGPYMSDASVAAKIEKLLDESTQPVFVFAITMENHGPWGKPRIEVPDAIRAAAPARSKAVLQYLSHVQNADRMIGRLRKALNEMNRDAVFCFYGDHLPSLPKAFRALGYDDPRTDYFIWHKRARTDNRTVTVSADALNRLLLETVTVALTDTGAAAGAGDVMDDGRQVGEVG
ncbi:LTA synthase family protein [Parvibaculum sp.]|uniref:LTA synthase family protein n=1 Tax=Parvibaculum sp. TaxID=2024848 RepID=UPI001E066F35|nr:LTA synthase family protein [Parvibaculum sp.]MBX3490792.1 LTA synthase family protein [Parvibaculum sp.]MCW5728696.1 LTA synthase family protein [Parvibaculum sp.]